ncbi:MAG: hypothetical protein H6839_04370 [Planctomycetes bacterium]|nr:hypothetical protein [Planctomycetota bacterium]
MTDLTAEKWSELAARLDAELEEAGAKDKSSTATAGKLVLVALLLIAVCAALLIVFNNEPYALLIAMPPGLLFLVVVSYILRYRRIAEHARNDMDRIRRDIRQWKKKRPDGVSVAPPKPEA